MKCVVIDIGNTSTSVGLYENGKVCNIVPVPSRDASVEDVDAALRTAGVERADSAIIASVAPRATPSYQWVLKRVYGIDAEIFDYRSPMPIGIDYPAPEMIGADRLADAIGAFARYGAPAIIADFGTALTFDVLSAKAKYVGGVIEPGLPLMTDYLHEKTALLPRVSLYGAAGKYGRSTEDAMRIGALIGHRGMVRETVAHLSKSFGRKTPHLCATGGYAEWALKGIGLPFHIDQDLTLFGLGVSWEYGKGKKK